MIRNQMNEKGTFSATVSSYAKGVEATLSQRREEMDEKWDEVDRGWDILKQRMVGIGITKPASSNESLVRLNIRGSHLNIHRSVLASSKRSSAAWDLADLFDSVWDERVPRDTDGRIVLDESPVCVKRLMHMLLNTSAGTSANSPRAGDAVLAGDEPYLAYVSRALGLSDPLPEWGIHVVGGSTILEPHGLGPLSATLQGWCPDRPDKLELVYRASRDGWRAADFHARCGEDSPSTITLFQVGNGNSASIAGGFSSIPWKATVLRSEHLPSRGSFVFMLKDGNETSTPDIFQTQKWGIKDEFSNYAIVRGSDILPTFGFFDLGTVLGEAITFTVGISGPTRRAYDIPDDSRVFLLNGKAVAEIEVFRVCPQGVRIPPAKRARTVENDTAAAKKTYWCPLSSTSREDSFDQRKFGDDIAGALMEERVALQQAQAELTTATHSVKAAGSAVAAVYGPAVAAGEKDAVVELSVHGTRMTTLRSTLQACPDSALAARFDESRWPATEKDVDEHGWRIIDCKPSVFSSVLDVLRMRKRESWAESSKTGGGGDVVRAVIDAADRDSFEVFVNKYFPGSESFIMEMVNPSTSSTALGVLQPEGQNV